MFSTPLPMSDTTWQHPAALKPAAAGGRLWSDCPALLPKVQVLLLLLLVVMIM
jgi:hypothetical protein